MSNSKTTFERPTEEAFKAAFLVVCRTWAADAIEAIDDEREANRIDRDVTEQDIRVAATPIVNGDEVDMDEWDSATLGVYQLVCQHYGVKPAIDPLPFSEGV